MTRFAGAYPGARSSRVCAASGRILAAGEPCVVAVVDLEADKLARLDFSLETWPPPLGSSPRPAPPLPEGARLIGYWRAAASAALPRSRPTTLDGASMLDLLSSIEPGEPRRDTLRLVLALLLMRARVMVSEPDPGRPGVLRLRECGKARPPEGPALIEVPEHAAGIDEAGLAGVMAELEALVAPDGSEPGTGDGA